MNQRKVAHRDRQVQNIDLLEDGERKAHMIGESHNESDL